MAQEAQLVGRSINDVLPSAVAAEQINAVRTAIETGELQVYEQQIQLGVGGAASKKEARLQDEEVRVIKNGVDEALLIVRDITAHKQAEAERQQVEAALRQSEARNRAILAALPDYLFCVGADGIYRNVVAHRETITLFPIGFDPVGLAMADILPPGIARRQLHYLEEALRTGALHTYEQQVLLGEQIRDEEVRVVQSGEDEVLFMIRDISDRKTSRTTASQPD